jgi:hypothetical protein
MWTGKTSRLCVLFMYFVLTIHVRWRIWAMDRTKTHTEPLPLTERTVHTSVFPGTLVHVTETNNTLTISMPNFSTTGDVTRYNAHRLDHVTLFSREKRKDEKNNKYKHDMNVQTLGESGPSLPRQSSRGLMTWALHGELVPAPWCWSCSGSRHLVGCGLPSWRQIEHTGTCVHDDDFQQPSTFVLLAFHKNVHDLSLHKTSFVELWVQWFMSCRHKTKCEF